MTDKIEEKREAVLEELEEIISDAEEIGDSELPRIRANVNRARHSLHDDAEFNYNVRLALQQIRSLQDKKRLC